MNSDILS